MQDNTLNWVLDKFDTWESVKFIDSTPVPNGKDGKDPVGKPKLPVPPVLQYRYNHNSHGNGLVRQTIIFTPQGNSRVVTSIRIR